jgi:hypothetical protein
MDTAAPAKESLHAVEQGCQGGVPGRQAWIWRATQSMV